MEGEERKKGREKRKKKEGKRERDAREICKDLIEGRGRRKKDENKDEKMEPFQSIGVIISNHKLYRFSGRGFWKTMRREDERNREIRDNETKRRGDETIGKRREGRDKGTRIRRDERMRRQENKKRW